ncbi:MAG: hypothetical protein IT207_06000 [Fimbriimonadaceae bacterium]|nr:hypothetical protein [Fimbriimonadaceae bacterium]
MPIARGLNASVQYDGKYANLGLVARVGSIKGAPVYFGIVAAQGDRFGPLIATSFPIGR